MEGVDGLDLEGAGFGIAIARGKANCWSAPSYTYRMWTTVAEGSLNALITSGSGKNDECIWIAMFQARDM